VDLEVTSEGLKKDVDASNAGACKGQKERRKKD